MSQLYCIGLHINPPSIFSLDPRLCPLLRPLILNKMNAYNASVPSNYSKLTIRPLWFLSEIFQKRPKYTCKNHFVRNFCPKIRNFGNFLSEIYCPKFKCPKYNSPKFLVINVLVFSRRCFRICGWRSVVRDSIETFSWLNFLSTDTKPCFSIRFEFPSVSSTLVTWKCKICDESCSIAE